MDKNLIAVVLISVGILVVWQKFVAVPPPKHAVVASADGGTAPDSVVLKADGTPDTAVQAAGKTAVAGPAVADGPATPTAAEQLVSYEMPGMYHAVLSTKGAALHDFNLLHISHQEKRGTVNVPIDLAPSKSPPLPFSVTFPSSGFTMPDNADFTVVKNEGNDRVFSWTDGKVTVEKHFSFVPGTYQIRLDVTVKNGSAAAVPASFELSMSGWQNPEAPAGFWIFKAQSIDTEGVCSGVDVKRQRLPDLLKEPFEVKGPMRLIAIDRKWFISAVTLAGADDATCRMTGEVGGKVVTSLTIAPVTIAAGGEKTWSLVGFVGPKVVADLDAVRMPDGSDAHLVKQVMYDGFWGGIKEVLARPMLWVLKKIHQGIGNWGVAIILLTALIKLLTWWPTTKSMKSAQAMARLKPEMDRLKTKYGDDKTKMNQEVMELYKKHKINPLGGCLPVLIQMPIYIALYSMLGNSVELYRANFGLWIHDLTAPDPFFVLPLLTGAGMFLQQKLSPTPPDASQKTMMMMMPIMYTGMSIFFPAGLTLYILTNTLLSIVQQRMATPKKV
ncbi:MAG: membrane protein insertase YidC [Polyangia bacterium]